MLGRGITCNRIHTAIQSRTTPINCDGSIFSWRYSTFSWREPATIMHGTIKWSTSSEVRTSVKITYCSYIPYICGCWSGIRRIYRFRATYLCDGRTIPLGSTTTSWSASCRATIILYTINRWFTGAIVAVLTLATSTTAAYTCFTRSGTSIRSKMSSISIS